MSELYLAMYLSAVTVVSIMAQGVGIHDTRLTLRVYDRPIIETNCNYPKYHRRVVVDSMMFWKIGPVNRIPLFEISDKQFG